ncbi:G-protein coupled receptor [Actinomadura luteofluorescens]|uniref:G-protein coupled receptor n=1 Tax=Actinomadura luteofluorescens TaxID=46163 RepID=UPI003D90E8CE
MDDLLNDAWAWLVNKLLDWALSTFQTFLTWWMSDSAYSVQLTGEKGGVLYMLREYTNWLVAAMAFAGFLVAAFRIAIQRKGEPFRQAMTQFFELAVIILTLATLVNLLNIAGDRYSHWIIEGMGPKDDAWIDNWKNGLDLLGGDQGDTSFILAFFALAAALSSAIQFVLMLFRSGALIILVGILPALAAARFSTYGNAAYRQCVGLLVSFVVVKPVIATIDAGALALMASKFEADRLFGLALAAGSVFALPATMRAVMPAATEGLSFFGIRQVGHFTYGGTAMTMRGRAAGFVTGLLSGGSSGSAATPVRSNRTGGGGGGGGWGGGGNPGGGSGGGAPTPPPNNGPGGGPGGGPAGGPGGGQGGGPGGPGGGPGGSPSGAPGGSTGGGSGNGPGGGPDYGSGGDPQGPSGADPSSSVPPYDVPAYDVPAYDVPDPDFSSIGGNGSEVPSYRPPDPGSSSGGPSGGNPGRTPPSGNSGPSGSTGGGRGPSGSP